MSHNTTFVLLILLKMLAVIAAILSAAYLAYHGKDGWGWLIFLAIVISPGNIKLDNDQTNSTKPEVVQKEPNIGH